MYQDIEEKEMVCPYCGEASELERDFSSGGYYVPCNCPNCGGDLSEFIKDMTGDDIDD